MFEGLSGVFCEDSMGFQGRSRVLHRVPGDFRSDPRVFKVFLSEVLFYRARGMFQQVLEVFRSVPEV